MEPPVMAGRQVQRAFFGRSVGRFLGWASGYFVAPPSRDSSRLPSHATLPRNRRILRWFRTGRVTCAPLICIECGSHHSLLSANLFGFCYLAGNAIAGRFPPFAVVF